MELRSLPRVGSGADNAPALRQCVNAELRGQVLESARLFRGCRGFRRVSFRVRLFGGSGTENKIEEFRAVFPDSGFVGVHDHGDGIDAVSGGRADEDLLSWDGVAGFDAVAVGVFFEKPVVIGKSPASPGSRPFCGFAGDEVSKNGVLHRGSRDGGEIAG